MNEPGHTGVKTMSHHSHASRETIGRAAASPRRRWLQRLIAWTYLMLPVAFACAQQQGSGGPPTSGESPASSTQVEEVIVTGSRIPQPNLTSVSPIVVVGEQDLLAQGTKDMSSMIQSLPQNFVMAGIDFSNNGNPLSGPGGLTNADLRGLGPQRTLVLMDGRRLGVGDANTGNPNPAPDLDFIPTPLVQRIDVVTGGASAVYGSDAIAGVINFVMKRDFQGIQVDGNWGAYDHKNDNPAFPSIMTEAGATPTYPSSAWDGQNRQVSVVMGTNLDGGKANLTGYFVYYAAQPISQGARDFSDCLMLAVPNKYPNIVDTPICDDSPNSNQFYAPGAGPPGYTVVGNQLLPYPQANSVPGSTFNSSPYQYLSRGDTRYTAGVFFHDDLQDWAKPYFEFEYMDDKTAESVGPSGSFEGSNAFDPTGSGGFLVNCTPANPLLSAQERTVLCGGAFPSSVPGTADVVIGRRNIEGDPREFFFEHNVWRAVFGSKGDLGDAWTYDAYASDYYSSFFQSNNNYLGEQQIQNALLVTQGPNGPVCQGGQLGCVPWNIWNQGGVNQAQLNYLYQIGTSYGTVDERIINVDFTGELGKYGLKVPTASDGVAVVAGYDFRSDTEFYQPDSEEEANNLAGFGGAAVPVNAKLSMNEGYAELRVPILSHLPLAEDLVVHGAYRFSDYSSTGSVNTYAIDAQWAPVHDVRFRGSFQHAIRAPNIIELYTSPTVTNQSVVGVDPCAGPTPSASLAHCENTHVTASEYGHIAPCPAAQCSMLVEGNSALSPEISDTISYGATFTPSFLPGFSASIDYYQIIIDQEIGVIPMPTIMQECLTAAILCNDIVRTPLGALFGASVASGGYLIQKSQNISVATVQGIDLQTNYKWSVGGLGSMLFSMNGSYLNSAQSQPSDYTPRYDCAGLYGPTCVAISPKWKHNARLTWDMTPIHTTLSLQWRYFGEVALDANSSQAGLAGTSPFGPGVYDAFNGHIPSYSWFDLSAMYNVNQWLQLRAGCNNCLDKSPPFVSTFYTGDGAGNTYSQYDTMGRQLFAAFTVTF
jgi:iron complex outermembrane recepter protein